MNLLNNCRILFAITFHFVPERLEYLIKVIHSLSEIPCFKSIRIITNSPQVMNNSMLGKVISEFPTLDLKIASIEKLEHPYQLTWVHKQIFKVALNEIPQYSHFIYLEDDEAFTTANLVYWLEGRQILSDTKFYPSLLRVEQNQHTGEWFSTDVLSCVDEKVAPKINRFGYSFISLPYPYQGLSVYDRPLLEEHLLSPSFYYEKYGNHQMLMAIKRGANMYYNTRELATYGQTYIDVPDGFYSRNLLGFCRRTGAIDWRALIHHLPNSYTNDTSTKIGKIPLKGVLGGTLL